MNESLRELSVGRIRGVPSPLERLSERTSLGDTSKCVDDEEGVRCSRLEPLRLGVGELEGARDAEYTRRLVPLDS